MPDPTHIVWQQLHWPVPMDSSTVLSLLRRLASDRQRGQIVFEARAEAGRVEHFVATEAHQVQALSGVLLDLVPGLLLETDERSAEPPVHVAVHLTMKGAPLPLIISTPGDSSRAVLAALSQAHFKGERLRLQVVVGRGMSGILTTRPLDPTQPLLRRLLHGVDPASGEILTRLRARQSEPTLQLAVRVAVEANSDGRRRALLGGLLAAFRTVESPGTKLGFVRRHESVEAPPRGRALRFTVSESMTLLGWPLDGHDLPGMPPSHPKLLPLRAAKVSDERIFALTTAPGAPRETGLSLKDSQFHAHVTGATGAGKSNVLETLVLGSIKAGQSVIVLDAKNDLTTDIMRVLPRDYWDSTVVLDPAAETTDAPVGLNPFSVPGIRPELIADGVLAIMKDLFPDAFGPRVSEVMHAALITLAHRPGSTLVDLPRLLTDVQFRRQATSSLDPFLLEYWRGFDALSDAQRAQSIAPALSRVNQFLLRPGIRRTLDQPEPRFTLSELFGGEQRILLAPMNAGLLGESSAALLGGMLVSLLWNLTLARANQPKEQRRPVSIFIDEAQVFVRSSGTDLADFLARARSLGVAVHIAHQHRSQMKAEILDALDANARSKIVMAPAPKDAKLLASLIPELTVEDFKALPPYDVYADLMHDATSTGWFSAKTLPPRPRVNDDSEVLAHSLTRFGGSLTATPKQETKSTSEPPIGRRSRRQ